MKKIENIVKRFEEIDLAGLDSVKLMQRYDTKFILPASKLHFFLEQLPSEYKILSINGRSAMSYKTIYYDTSDFQLYLKHHNGIFARHKIRHRTYTQSETGFLEVKAKNNKGQTVKDRLFKEVASNNWTDPETQFIRSKAQYNSETLEPKVCVKYTRFTLVNVNAAEKLTIDLDLHFSNSENSFNLNQIAVIEIKQSSRSRSMVLDMLKSLHVKSISLSKYCLGVNFLYPEIKKNNFKEKLITLNKIINDPSITHIAGV